jgi:hypothetical protein
MRFSHPDALIKRIRGDQKYAEIMRPPSAPFSQASVFVSIFDDPFFFIGIGGEGT